MYSMPMKTMQDDTENIFSSFSESTISVEFNLIENPEVENYSS